MRRGFFTREEFDRLLGFLPGDLRDFCLFAFLTGMSCGEIKSLAWSSVTHNTIRLKGEDAKTRKPRTIVCTGELAALLERRQAARSVKSPNGVLMASTVFHREGSPVGEFKKSWRTACLAARLGAMVCRECNGESMERTCPQCKVETKYVGRIFRDFRRTGVRNLRDAGVPKSVAMKISGHRTEAVFLRYDITDEDDSAQAMVNLQKYHEAEKKKIFAISAKKRKA